MHPQRKFSDHRCHLLQEVGINEDERRGEPDPAPACGEHGGARCFLEGEAGDDVVEERVGEAADAVDAVVGGGTAGGEASGVVDWRLGEAGVDVRQELLRVHGHRRREDSRARGARLGFRAERRATSEERGVCD